MGTQRHENDLQSVKAAICPSSQLLGGDLAISATRSSSWFSGRELTVALDPTAPYARRSQATEKSLPNPIHLLETPDS